MLPAFEAFDHPPTPKILSADGELPSSSDPGFLFIKWSDGLNSRYVPVLDRDFWTFRLVRGADRIKNLPKIRVLPGSRQEDRRMHVILVKWLEELRGKTAQDSELVWRG